LHAVADASLTRRAEAQRDALADADLVLIVTAHPGVDHDLVAKRARLLVDLRGVTRSSGVRNVVRL